MKLKNILQGTAGIIILIFVGIGVFYFTRFTITRSTPKSSTETPGKTSVIEKSSSGLKSTEVKDIPSSEQSSNIKFDISMDDMDGKLHLIDVDSGDQKIFNFSSQGSTWSPDGKWLAIGQAKRLMLINSTTGSSKEIPVNADYVYYVKWLPDSEKILYYASSGDISDDTVRDNGYRIFNLETENTILLSPTIKFNCNCNLPEITFDGKWGVFNGAICVGGKIQTKGIYLINLENEQLIKTNIKNPYFIGNLSSTDFRAVFQDYRDSQRAYFIEDILKSPDNILKIENSEISTGVPADSPNFFWSPDGKVIYEYFNLNREISIVDPISGKVITTFNIPKSDKSNFNFSPDFSFLIIPNGKIIDTSSGRIITWFGENLKDIYGYHLENNRVTSVLTLTEFSKDNPMIVEFQSVNENGQVTNFGTKENPLFFFNSLAINPKWGRVLKDIWEY